MKKILQFASQNIFLLIAIFFIVFIPLYPKLPVLDVKNTWVYIRIEDFLVAFVALLFLIQLARKKVTIKTPLTLPIVAFWIIGAIATFHGVLFIFPQLEGVFPQIALLHYLRHIEYVLLFFIGYVAIKDKKFVTPIVMSFAITLILIVLYGLGQRYLGFPAFLTMNEEFAKGIPLKLSALSRVPSTFAGHYDLAAYLILMIPFMGSMVFAYKKWYAKIFFLLTAVSGLVLLMMTASRVSFAVYLVTITVMLILQKQKKFIIPVIIFSIILLQGFQGLSQRFASTITQVDLVVDARTGEAIGIAENYTEGEEVVIKKEEKSTGENLPQGTKYINVPQNYSRNKLVDGSGRMIGKSGNVIVKKAFAYDVSYTTRLQGTWPRAVQALQRNYLFGSGYSSINIASDNNYLRILGEIGFLGFLAFCSIFLIFFIYAWKVLPHIDNKIVRGMALGVSAGIFGLMLNAVLIDVFEASKVAFSLWLLLGITVGLMHMYQKGKIDYVEELKRIFFSKLALIVYLFIVGITIFAPSFQNYFVADDFTWLRWAADCTLLGNGQCLTPMQMITTFFTDSQNFFYRPGTKLYFYLMFPFFELFPSTYHLVSFLLHFTATVFVFFILQRLFNNKFFSFLGALLFLTLSVHAEAVYWISVTGHMFAYNAILFALLMFMYWRKNRNKILFVLILLSLFIATWFYEIAVVGPILLIAYDLIMEKKLHVGLMKKKLFYLLFIALIPLYYLMRTFSHSFWMQGDYNYSIPDLPFNLAGNGLGYIFLVIFGTAAMPPYAAARAFAVSNIGIAIIGLVIGFVLLGSVVWIVRKLLEADERRIVLTGIVLFIIPLLPFLGFGNISPRYAYVASVGIIIFAVFLIKKLHEALTRRHYIVANTVVIIMVSAYVLMNVMTLLRVAGEWKHAGDITSSLITNMNLTYNTETNILIQTGSVEAKKVRPEEGIAFLPKNPEFYFVNVPIRYREAWVFPVGLNDAMWFAFREFPVKIHHAESLEEAFRAQQATGSVLVFEFLPDGSVVLVSNGPVGPIPVPTNE